MFVNHCTACGKRQLILPSQVTGTARVDGVSVIAYTCWCGSEQLFTEGRPHTGRGLPVAA